MMTLHAVSIDMIILSSFIKINIDKLQYKSYNKTIEMLE